MQAIQLSNPLSYDADLASNLASLTSSCSASSYGFTSPTAYALNVTATTVPASVTATPPPTCTGSYTVQATDDCNSVAKALNVSTYNLLYNNNLDLYYQNFAAAVNTTHQRTSLSQRGASRCLEVLRVATSSGAQFNPRRARDRISQWTIPARRANPPSDG